jgi:hypothetical protein
VRAQRVCRVQDFVVSDREMEIPGQKFSAALTRPAYQRELVSALTAFEAEKRRGATFVLPSSRAFV